jgi:hypothetical protein
MLVYFLMKKWIFVDIM